METDYITNIIHAAQRYGYNAVNAVSEYIQTENKLQNVNERYGIKTDEQISDQNRQQAYNEIMLKMLKIYVGRNK